MSFGEQLSSVRRRSGLTQEQFAEQLQVSRQAVSKWENGLSCPDILMLPEIAEYFGVSVDVTCAAPLIPTSFSSAFRQLF